MVGISSLALTVEEEVFLRKAQPSGVILFSRNIQDPVQLQALISAVRDRVSPRCTLWIDQEGGRVQRLRAPFTRFPSPWRLALLAVGAPDLRFYPATTGEAQAVALARMAGWLCGIELATLGIGVNCAPVLDIREAGADPVIGARAFGDSPQGVVMLAGAWLEGLQTQDVMAVGKHFPGHGAAKADSHKRLPILSESREVLERWALLPFKHLMARLPALMTAHVVAQGLGEHQPATCSPALLQGLLRQVWGYQGLIVSDALEMGALSGSLETRARQAVLAGCDLVLCCTGRVEDNASTLAGITTARAAMGAAERAQRDQRITRALQPYRPPPGDWKALLQHPDYLQARHLLEALAEKNPEEDPTESLEI